MTSRRATISDDPPRSRKGCRSSCRRGRAPGFDCSKRTPRNRGDAAQRATKSAPRDGASSSCPRPELRIGIDAPLDVQVIRSELLKEPEPAPGDSHA
ncbi:MAG: carbon storage regulator [Chromatiaceae bacterium]|nr:MAG: carbon storage regulator [Chromatiaceae bacterium]